MQEKTKQFWFGRWRGWRGVIYTLILVLAMTAVGFGWPRLVDAASGAPAVVQVKADDQPAEKCCSPDAQRLGRHMAAKFRKGKINKDHGVDVGYWYKQPKKVRNVWIRKIARYLEKHPGQMAKVQAKRGASSCYPASTCYATEMYEESVDKSTCVSSGYLSYNSGRHVCERGIGYIGHGLTKRQVQIGGAVVICGAQVAVGVRSGAGPFASILGSVGCGWALWEALDP